MYVDKCQVYISSVLSGMTGRIAVTGAIFKKVLELNLTTIGQVSIGKIVNLAGYDVQRLDKVCRRICTYHQHVDCLLCAHTDVFSSFAVPEDVYPLLHIPFCRLFYSPYTSF